MSTPINKWTLRCYLRIAGYVTLFLNSDSTIKIEKTKDKVVTSASKFPPGSRNVFYKVYDKATDDLLFTAHIPLDASGVPLDGRTFKDDLDPKVVLFQGVRYVRDEGWADPAEGHRAFGWVYAKWRKARCRVFQEFGWPVAP